MKALAFDYIGADVYCYLLFDFYFDSLISLTLEPYQQLVTVPTLQLDPV